MRAESRSVDRGDADLLHLQAQLSGPQQGAQLVLVAAARHLQHPVVAARRVAAQAGLGVAQPPAGRPAEQQGRHVIAQAAAQRHGSGELAHPQRHAPGGAHPPRHGGDVRRRVLAVAVGADHVRPRPEPARPLQPGAQRLALARVGRVGDHLRPALAGRGEHRGAGGVGAVVDDEHPAARQLAMQVLHQAHEPLVGLVGGDEDGQGGPARPDRAARGAAGPGAARGWPGGEGPADRAGGAGASGARRAAACGTGAGGRARGRGHLRPPARCRGCRRWRARRRWRAG